MRQRLPNKRRCETFTVQVNQKSWHITVGYYPSGKVGEVFFVAAKAGSEFREILDLLGVGWSRAMQNGDSFEGMVSTMAKSSSHSIRLVAEGLSGCEPLTGPYVVSASEEQA